MRSIRSRLTLAFAGALLATLFVLATSLYWVRSSAVERQVEVRLHALADQTKQLIEIARELAPQATYISPDSLDRGALEPRMLPLLETLPEFVILKDRFGWTLFRSHDVRQLPVDQVQRLDAAALAMQRDSVTMRVSLLRQDLLMTARTLEPSRSTRPTRVWVAVRLDEPSAELRQLVTTIFIIAPFLIGLSVLFAYVIAGRAFRPIDHIIDQVEAITDGRSLHRRLAIGTAGDELARLSATLNAMIGRLETSFGALRRFTADASHELKTPLTVLRADVERVMSPNASNNDKAIALEEALQQVTRMADLVESLLTLARADEGRFDLYREPIELAPLVREVVETARFLGEDAGLSINTPRIDEAHVKGDLTRLRQLFMNLATNAIKYTPRGGRVDISLISTGTEAQFIVRDTGIGIAAADLPYVFERFWRADRVRSRGAERGGFGLGLAISQWIAQAHGGSLTVQSKLTRGSMFTVTLPIGVDTEAEKLPEPPRAVIEA